MVVEHSIGSADDGLAVACGIPRQADARLNIVGVSLNSFLQSEQSVCWKREALRGLERGRKLHVVAQAVVQGDARGDAPGILPERADWNVVERVAGTADALNEISGKPCAIGLYGGEIGKIRQAGRAWVDEAEARSAKSSEIVDAAVVHGERRGDRKVVHVGAELHVVAADRPGKVVGELVALLDALNVGVGFTPDVGDAGDVDGILDRLAPQLGDDALVNLGRERAAGKEPDALRQRRRVRRVAGQVPQRQLAEPPRRLGLVEVRAAVDGVNRLARRRVARVAGRERAVRLRPALRAAGCSGRRSSPSAPAVGGIAERRQEQRHVVVLRGRRHRERHLHVRVERRPLRRGEIGAGLEGQAVRSRLQRRAAQQICRATVVVGDGGRHRPPAGAVEDLQPQRQAAGRLPQRQVQHVRRESVLVIMRPASPVAGG